GRAAARARLWWGFRGGGGEEAVVGGAAAPLGASIVFAGFQPDVSGCLAAAEIVAMPSLKEGLGVAALEAMAASRPVVASRVGGLAGVVVDGESGVLVPPGGPAPPAAALAGLDSVPAPCRPLAG